MSPLSLTPLQLDPLGGMTARLITVTCVITGIVVAVLMSVVSWAQVSSPGIQVLALLALAGAGALMITGTDPYRAPLSMMRMAVIWSTLGLAALLDALSQWGTSVSVRDDWGPVAFAIVILMTGSYRSAAEIVRLTIGATVFLILLGIAEVATVYPEHPARYIASPIVTATPVAATGIAAAAFSRALVVNLLRWRKAAATAQRDVIDDLRSGLVPSVRNARLALLNAEIVPFLREIVDLAELSPGDSDRARELAAGLRSVMVPDSGSNWLESVVDEVIDPGQLAERMGSEQRGSLKALLAALRDSGLAGDAPLAVRLRSQETTGYLHLTAGVLDPGAMRTALAPYFVVARSFFPEASLEVEKSELLLEVQFTLG